MSKLKLLRCNRVKIKLTLSNLFNLLKIILYIVLFTISLRLMLEFLNQIYEIELKTQTMH